MGGYPVEACRAIAEGARTGEPWVDLSPWSGAFPCVASAWPAETVGRLLEWVDANAGKLTKADDGVTQRFLQAERVWPYATVPSLVDHPDVEPSLIGRSARAGSDRFRVACVPPVGRDVSKIVW